VKEEILVAIGLVGPAGQLLEHLMSQITSDAQSLDGAVRADAVGPVGVLVFANGAPVASNELLQAARVHLATLYVASAAYGGDLQ
jgi:hypothetical protein